MSWGLKVELKPKPVDIAFSWYQVCQSDQITGHDHTRSVHYAVFSILATLMHCTNLV